MKLKMNIQSKMKIEKFNYSTKFHSFENIQTGNENEKY